MSPDIFLSQRLVVEKDGVILPKIRYDGSGLKGSPAAIVANLLACHAARMAGTYQTPGFVSAPTNPNTTAPRAVRLETAAMNAYYHALLTGNPGLVHNAVDVVNKIRQVKSGVELVPPSDLEIIEHDYLEPGDTARWLEANRDGDAQVFWSDAGSAILSEYAGS